MKQMRLAMAARAGFTIIELIIAMAIIAILAGVVVPNFFSYVGKARIQSSREVIHALEGAITVYNAHTGQFPTRLQDLVKKPADKALEKKWQGPYLKQKEISTDPWGARYVYQVTPQAEHPYELYSYGPNGKSAPKSEWISVWDEE